MSTTVETFRTLGKRHSREWRWLELHRGRLSRCWTFRRRNLWKDATSAGEWEPISFCEDFWIMNESSTSWRLGRIMFPGKRLYFLRWEQRNVRRLMDSSLSSVAKRPSALKLLSVLTKGSLELGSSIWGRQDMMRWTHFKKKLSKFSQLSFPTPPCSRSLSFAFVLLANIFCTVTVAKSHLKLFEQSAFNTINLLGELLEA